MLKAYPIRSPDSIAVIKVFECDNNAIHRDIGEDEQDNHCGQYHGLQCNLFLQPSQTHWTLRFHFVSSFVHLVHLCAPIVSGKCAFRQ